MLFIVSGVGGRTGAGASKIIAKVANDMGVLCKLNYTLCCNVTNIDKIIENSTSRVIEIEEI